MTQSGQLVFRPAAAEDAEAVARLHADSWRHHYRGAYSDEFLDGDVAAERLEVWTERLAAPGRSTATILAEEGDHVLGFVHVVLDDDPEWGSLVDNLHVTRPRKRRGIGRALMAEAAHAVLAHGGGGVYLWVLEQNTDAQAFYAARGGRCNGRRLVRAPGGIAHRLNGSPSALRYAWADPTVLLA